MEEIVEEIGQGLALARDRKGNVMPLPPALGLYDWSHQDPGWEVQSQGMHEEDNAEMARAWWAALNRPGHLQQVVLRQKRGNVWHGRLTKILDLSHQSDIGMVLVGTVNLGTVDSPDEPVSTDRLIPEDDDVAYFERPIWLLQELDSAGLVMSTEGDVEPIFGRKAADLVGANVLDFIHPDDHEACLQMWLSLLAERGGSRTIRQRIVRPDETVRWIESTVMNRLGDDGTGVVLSISHDITERRRHERDLRRRAVTDPVTGLPNRFSLEGSLADLLEAGSATVAFVDLDGFKSVNDTRGHHVGDVVLEAIGLRLHNNLTANTQLGEGATAGRWGGDEFVLIGPGDCEHELRAVIDLCFADPISIGAEQWHPSCSYGIAHGWGRADPDALIRSADTAMYDAKEARPG